MILASIVAKIRIPKSFRTHHFWFLSKNTNVLPFHIIGPNGPDFSQKEANVWIIIPYILVHLNNLEQGIVRKTARQPSLLEEVLVANAGMHL